MKRSISASSAVCSRIRFALTFVRSFVVAEITEGNDRLTGSDGRNERRGQHIVTEQLTRLTGLIGRLPQILTVFVLELTDYSDGLVVHDELGALTIRTLECINQIDDFVGSDFRSACCGHTDFCTAGLRKDTQRLTNTVTVEEGILFGIGQCLTELLDDVFLKLEGIVIQKFLSDLHCNMQLVGIEVNLAESSVADRR